MGQSTAHADPVPEGWFLDPDRPGFDRWWNGREWTADRQPTSTEPFRAFVVRGYRTRRIVSAIVLVVAYLVAIGLGTQLPRLIRQPIDFVAEYGVVDDVLRSYIAYIVIFAVPTLLAIIVIIATHVVRKKQRRREFPNGRVPMSPELRDGLVTGVAFASLMIFVAATSASSSPAQAPPKTTTRRSISKKVNNSSIYRGKYTFGKLGGGSNW
jgi:phosphoglycerol transferase MdoB-like AlkP superfamily enzyme